MSIALFRTFVAVSERGSFAAAAAAVNVTHAAVGQQMRRLEDQLQVALFDRTERTPRLNPLGAALVPKVREVLRAYDTILDDLTGEAAVIGELSLGAVPSVIRALVPISVKRLIGLYPDLHIRVVPELSDDLQEQVERGTIDAAVLSAPDVVPPTQRWLPVAEEELVLLTAPEIEEDDPLVILGTMPFIRHTRRAAVGVLAETWLSANRITVRDAMEMGSLENVASMVAHNLGVSIAPNLCVPDPTFAQLRKIPLGAPAAARALGILTRADCSRMRLVERLAEELQRTVADHRPGPVSD